MRVTRLRLRDFRTYAAADVVPGGGLTVVHGPNGAGKTNLLEGVYFACTGRSCRTANEREVLRFGAQAARAEVDLVDTEGTTHALKVGYAPGEVKRLLADGAPVERLLDVGFRPLVSVFLPDRLELVKGPPALRRAHLDQVVAAARPARAATRRAYARALAQRNALLARVRAGLVPRHALEAWDLELARHGIALRDDRAAVVADLVTPFATAAQQLGLHGELELRFRPRTRAVDPEALAAELGERLDSDLERGFTGHGPHRDDLALLRDGRELRTYGSRGEQRLGLLALLLAEREVLGAARGRPPLLLLDDVMSELDSDRRTALVRRLVRDGGQSVITTTDVANVPGAEGADVIRVAVRDGAAVTLTTAQERAA
ncbi:MAG: DNA replication and repair protein RecF [Actinomycetota bacterium]|jgi:DNA replication and repair protein RecF|nr:DNA replication and repair protein RecF [Actinomycetota bacterium]